MSHGSRSTLWRNATIPYEVDEGDFPLGSPDRDVIAQAIAHWNQVTVVRLIPRSDESDYAVFEDVGTWCSSKIGRIGGRQSVTCDLEGGGFNFSSIVHEIGHTVGLLHEHQRSDRDGRVIVPGDDPDNCAIEQNGRLLTDYDCGSRMHYPYGPSPCGNITAVSPGPCEGAVISQRLSGRDIWGVSRLYDVGLLAVATWEDDTDGNGRPDIQSSGIAARGRNFFGPIRVNRLRTNQRKTPEVAFGYDTVYVWADDPDGNGRFRIKTRGFRKGSIVLSERNVSSTAAGDQFDPHVAVGEVAHSFVVVWAERTPNGLGDSEIKVRSFYRGGQGKFPEFRVNSVRSGLHSHPRIAMDNNGGFVVVWEQGSGPGGNQRSSIEMHMYSANGTLRWGGTIPARNGRHERPRIAMDTNGDFAVMWEDTTNRDPARLENHVRLAGFKANGLKVFERAVTRVGESFFGGDLAVHHFGSGTLPGSHAWAVITWSTGGEIDIAGFDTEGAQKFGRTRINTDEGVFRVSPRIGMSAGSIEVVWLERPTGQSRSDLVVRSVFRHNPELERFTTRLVANVSGRTMSNPSFAVPRPPV